MDERNKLLQMLSGLVPSHDSPVEYGNIDLAGQPIVQGLGGKSSTVRSISVNFDGIEYLIPTVANDGSRILSDEEAIEQFRRTGKHLGAFKTTDEANRAAERIHSDYESGRIKMKPNQMFPSHETEWQKRLSRLAGE